MLADADAGDDAGTALQAAVPFLNAADWYYLDQVRYPYTIVGADWQKQNVYDINGTARSATAPNMGADETN